MTHKRRNNNDVCTSKTYMCTYKLIVFIRVYGSGHCKSYLHVLHTYICMHKEQALKTYLS